MEPEALDKIINDFAPFIVGPDATDPPRFLRLMAEEIERETRHRAWRWAQDFAGQMSNLNRRDDLIPRNLGL